MSTFTTPSGSKVLKTISALLVAVVPVSLSMIPASGAITSKRVPSAPVLQSLVAGDKSFTITILAPTDSGTSAVTQYSVSLNGGSWSTLGTPDVVGKAKTVGVRANDVDYRVSVRAKNSVGWGDILDAGTVHPVQPTPVYPGAPIIVAAADYTCHYLRIEIVAPTVTFGKITRYRYRLSDKHPWNNEWTTAGVKVIHDALKRPFTLKVQAFNNAKYSGWGEVVEVLIPNTFPKCPFYE
jgi:hypothetical protein